MKIEVKARPGAEEDIRNLETPQLKLEALKYLLRLEQDPKFTGLPLDVHPVVGDLSDCRKILFNNALYRIVFRLIEGEDGATIADVIAVGPRAEMEVYREAVRRLGREAAA